MRRAQQGPDQQHHADLHDMLELLVEGEQCAHHTSRGFGRCSRFDLRQRDDMNVRSGIRARWR
jgi:hypothetical protein